MDVDDLVPAFEEPDDASIFSALDRPTRDDTGSRDDPFLVASQSFHALSQRAAEQTRGLYLKGLTMSVPNQQFQRYAQTRKNLEAQREDMIRARNQTRLTRDQLLNSGDPNEIEKIRSAVRGRQPPPPRQPPEVSDEIGQLWRDRIKETLSSLVGQYRRDTLNRWTATHPDGNVETGTKIAEAYVKNVAAPPLQRFYESLSSSDYSDMPVWEELLKKYTFVYWNAAARKLLADKEGTQFVGTPRLRYAEKLYSQYAFGREEPAPYGYYAWFNEWKNSLRDQRLLEFIPRIKTDLVDRATIGRENRSPPPLFDSLLAQFNTTAKMAVETARLAKVADKDAYETSISNYIRPGSTEKTPELWLLVYPVSDRFQILDDLASQFDDSVNERVASLRRNMLLFSAPNDGSDPLLALDSPIERPTQEELRAKLARLSLNSSEVSPDRQHAVAQRLRAVFEVDAKRAQLAAEIDKIDYILRNTAYTRQVPLEIEHRRPSQREYPLEVEVAVFNPTSDAAQQAYDDALRNPVQFTWYWQSPDGERQTLKTDTTTSRVSRFVISGDGVRSGFYYASAVVQFSDGQQRTLTSVRARSTVEAFDVRSQAFFVTGMTEPARVTWIPPPPNNDQNQKIETFRTVTVGYENVGFVRGDVGEIDFLSDRQLLDMGLWSDERVRSYFSFKEIVMRLADANDMPVVQFIADLIGQPFTLDSVPVRLMVIALQQPQNLQRVGPRAARYANLLGANLDTLETYYMEQELPNNLTSFIGKAIDGELLFADLDEVENERRLAARVAVSQLSYPFIVSSNLWVFNRANSTRGESLKRDFFFDQPSYNEFLGSLDMARNRNQEFFNCTSGMRMDGANEDEIELAKIRLAGTHGRPLNVPVGRWEQVRDIPKRVVERCGGQWRGQPSTVDAYPTVETLQPSFPLRPPVIDERLDNGYDMPTFFRALRVAIRAFNRSPTYASLAYVYRVYFGVVGISLLAETVPPQRGKLTFEDVGDQFPNVPVQYVQARVDLEQLLNG